MNGRDIPEAFAPWYNSIFDPDEILQEMNQLSEIDPSGAPLREQLYNYRFYTKKEGRKEIVCDRFLAFWVNLQFYETTIQKSKFRLKMACNRLKSMLDNKTLSGIFGGEQPPEQVLYEQLYGAARRLLASCQTDRTYNALMFGFFSLKRHQLIEKMQADFFDAAVSFSWRCGLLDDFPVVGRAALDAWSDEFPDSEESVWRRIGKISGEENIDQLRALLSRG